MIGRILIVASVVLLLVSPSMAQKDTVYKVECIQGVPTEGPDKAEKRLNILATFGWELVSTSSYNCTEALGQRCERHCLFLKRLENKGLSTD